MSHGLFHFYRNKQLSFAQRSSLFERQGKAVLDVSQSSLFHVC